MNDLNHSHGCTHGIDDASQAHSHCLGASNCPNKKTINISVTDMAFLLGEISGTPLEIAMALADQSYDQLEAK